MAPPDPANQVFSAEPPDAVEQEKASSRSMDEELKVIGMILRELKAQGPDAAARIVAYIADRFEGGKK